MAIAIAVRALLAIDVVFESFEPFNHGLKASEKSIGLLPVV
jgi:hypothetical protein